MHKYRVPDTRHVPVPLCGNVLTFWWYGSECHRLGWTKYRPIQPFTLSSEPDAEFVFVDCRRNWRLQCAITTIRLRCIPGHYEEDLETATDELEGDRYLRVRRSFA
jgi:hypothetical protein